MIKNALPSDLEAGNSLLKESTHHYSDENTEN